MGLYHENDRLITKLPESIRLYYGIHYPLHFVISHIYLPSRLS